MMPQSDLYIRQQALGLKLDVVPAVVGVGGVGYWVAKLLAMSGVARIFLFDEDRVEESNRNRLDLPESAVGTLKVLAAYSAIAAIRPDAEVVCLGRADEITLPLVLGDVTALIDCTDRASTQRWLYKFCAENNVRYIRSGYDVTHFTVADVASSWQIGDDDDAGYSVDPSWVIPAILPAAYAVAKLLKYPKLTKGEEVYDEEREKQEMEAIYGKRS